MGWEARNALPPPSGFKYHFVLADGGRSQRTFLRTTADNKFGKLAVINSLGACHVCTVTYNFRAFEIQKYGIEKNKSADNSGR